MDGGRMRGLLVASRCSLVLGAVGGCGAGTRTATETTTTTVTQTITRTVKVHAPSDTTATTTASPTTTSSTPSPTTEQPTNTLSVHDFSGNRLIVTVNGVIPATPAPAGFAPTAGTGSWLSRSR